MIGKWLISRSIERETPPRGWLRAWIDRDEELWKFEADSRRMEARLRGDAGAWLNQGADSTFHVVDRWLVKRGRPALRGPYGRRAVWAAAGCALVASVVAMALLQPATRAPRADAPVNTPQLGLDGGRPLTPDDGEHLIAAWRAGRAEVVAWQAGAAALPRKLDNLDWPIATMLLSARQTAATADRVRATLAAAATAQKQDLADGMKSAFTFFSHRLPASVAQLVGLQEG